LELTRRQEVGLWQSALEDGFDIVPNTGCFNLQNKSSRDIDVADEFTPASSPVSFLRVGLRATKPQ